MRRIAVTASLVLAALAAVLPQSASAAAGPDLVVKSASVSQPTFDSIRVSDVTKNRGTKKATASKTGYFLSTDQQRGNDVKLGHRDVPGLAAGSRSMGFLTTTLPSGLTGGATYHVFACADSTHVVAETDEKNNCTLATGTITAPVTITWNAGNVATVTGQTDAGTCDPTAEVGSCVVPSGSATVTLTPNDNIAYSFSNWTSDPNHPNKPCSLDGTNANPADIVDATSDQFCDAIFHSAS